MIVPMKKAVIITLHKEREASVNALRKLGILHVQYEQPPIGEDIHSASEKINLVNSALEILQQNEFLAESPKVEEKKITDLISTARHIVESRSHMEHLKEYALTVEGRINQLKDWGDFNPQEIEELAKRRVFVRLYQVPQKEMQLIPAGAVVKHIFSEKGVVNCAIISYGEKIEVPFKEVPLPKSGLSDLKARLLEDERAMQKLKEEISRFVSYKEDFLNIKKSLENELEFRQAIRGMGEAGSVSYLTGYAPFDKLAPLSALAKEKKWALLINEPTEEDNPPTLLRNPKWVNLIAPVYKLMEVAPGYRELDVSPVFLLFLALFFGMIIGDAGYGAVYFALTFLAQQKLSAKAKDKTVFFLFYLFSSCAILWGLLTGTVFGQQWYLAKGFKALAPALNDAKFLMAFCFLLGAVQLSIAHIWQAIKKLPSLAALSDIGFICLVWAGYFLAKMFILSDPFPNMGKWLIWSGVLLIIFFVNPQRNLLKAVGAGLGTLALGAVGNFGDVVSYIRLFAVGLAGVAVADSVNILAAGSGNIVAQVLILFVGHSINIVLGPMSVLVHGIRLNVLEFSVLHGNITWCGVSYKPLRETN